MWLYIGSTALAHGAGSIQLRPDLALPNIGLIDAFHAAFMRGIHRIVNAITAFFVDCLRMKRSVLRTILLRSPSNHHRLRPRQDLLEDFVDDGFTALTLHSMQTRP